MSGVWGGLKKPYQGARNPVKIELTRHLPHPMPSPPRRLGPQVLCGPAVWDSLVHPQSEPETGESADLVEDFLRAKETTP